jgi:hypothetical protein
MKLALFIVVVLAFFAYTSASVCDVCMRQCDRINAEFTDVKTKCVKACNKFVCARTMQDEPPKKRWATKRRNDDEPSSDLKMSECKVCKLGCGFVKSRSFPMKYDRCVAKCDRFCVDTESDNFWKDLGKELGNAAKESGKNILKQKIDDLLRKF